MNDIRHAGIYVRDLEGMKNFYCSSFGMEVEVHEFEKGSYIDTVLDGKDISLELYKLKRGTGSLLELLCIHSPELESVRTGKVYQTGACHIALTVKNLDRLYEELQNKGIKFISRPCLSSNGSARVCFCMDPENNFLELVEELQDKDDR